MTSYVKNVGDLSVPDGFENQAAEQVAEQDMTAEFDSVTKPAHYAGHTGIECKAAMESMLGTDAYTAYMQGCAFKYLWRWRDKNGIEDLKKARECIDNVIHAIEGDKS